MTLCVVAQMKIVIKQWRTRTLIDSSAGPILNLTNLIPIPQSKFPASGSHYNILKGGEAAAGNICWNKNCLSSAKKAI